MIGGIQKTRSLEVSNFLHPPTLFVRLFYMSISEYVHFSELPTLMA